MAKGDVLKSVRVREVNASIDARSNGFGDIEVRVIDEGGKKITVGWITGGFDSYGMDFKTTGKYSEYTPDNFISLMMWIESSKKRNENPGRTTRDVLESQEDFTQDYYKIIQDPYDKDNVPRSRSFSGDPYYLNNKTKVSIFWSMTLLPGASIDGAAWSDEDGGELPQPQEAYLYSDNENVGTSRDKSQISKYVFISNEESGEKFTLNENLTDFLTDVKSLNDIHTWASPIQAESVLDETILNKIVEIWKTKVVDYDDLGVCYNKIKKPSPFSCNEVVYKSPIGGFVPDEEKPTPTEESVQTQGTPKIKLSVVLPEDLELKVKQDLNGLMVYIGDPPPPEGAFVFQDDFDNLEELDDEYMESGFAGEEEAQEEAQAEREEAREQTGSSDPDADPSTGQPSDVSPIKSVSERESIVILMDILIKEGGFTKEQAAGICGNIKKESNFQFWNIENGAANVQSGAPVGDESRWSKERAISKDHYKPGAKFSGIGLAQWTYGRRYKMEKYVGQYLTKKGVQTKALKNGFFDTDPKSHGNGTNLENYLKTVPYLFEAQASFLIFELKGSYSRIVQSLFNGKSSGNSSTLIKNGSFINQSGGKPTKTVGAYCESILCDFEVPGTVGGALKNKSGAKSKYQEHARGRITECEIALATYNDVKKMVV